MPPFRHFPPKPSPEPKPEAERKLPLWPCPTCDGLGRTPNNTKCKRCGGTGERNLEGKA